MGEQPADCSRQLGAAHVPRAGCSARASRRSGPSEPISPKWRCGVGAEGLIGLKLKAPFLAPDHRRDRDHDDDGENGAGEENGFGELVRVSDV